MEKAGEINVDGNMVETHNVSKDIKSAAMDCYKEAFKKAGVKQKDLDDPETKAMIMEMLANKENYETANLRGTEMLSTRKTRKTMKKQIKKGSKA